MKVNLFGYYAEDVDTRYRVSLRHTTGGSMNHSLEIGEVFKLGKDWQYRLRDSVLPSSECFRTRRDCVRGLLGTLTRLEIEQ